jgi:hypothetical protein
MQLDLELLPHQIDFIEDTTTRDLALVGGRGCGKTYSLCLKLITLAALHAGYVGAALSPTGPMATKTIIPGMLDALEQHGVKYRYNRSERKFVLYFGRKQTIIYVLSAENIRDGLGLNLAFFGIDECDTINETVALEAWRKLKGALRSGVEKHRQAVAVSTPEGFGFLYRHWVKELTPENQDDRRLIRGKGTDNVFLDASFFDDLRATYPAAYLAAYIDGEFVNLTNGPVYNEWDNQLNNTNMTLADLPETVKTIHIGMDFNVLGDKSRGISIVAVAVLNQTPYVIGEHYGSGTTKEAIAQIKKAYPGKRIMCAPDASGAAEKTSASDSDIAQLQKAGFVCMNKPANPIIRNRVNSVNAQILNGKGERRLKVNVAKCPILAECLTQQPWDEKTGKPKKDGMLDGPLDALGYVIYANWPVKSIDFAGGTLQV